MRGDHLLSVAGVSEQAGSMCTHSLTHTHTEAHASVQTQTDRHILTQREVYQTHAHTHVPTAESVGSMHNRQALNSYTN